MKTSTLLILAALIPSTLLAAPDEVVAKVGGREVKTSEIKPYLDALNPTEREAITKNKEELGRFVRLILMREAVLKDAAAAGWDKKPEVVAAAARARDQIVVESYLAEVSKVPADFPSTEEVAKAYEAEKERLVLPRRFRLSQIFIAYDDAKPAALEKAKDLAATLKQQPDEFANLARRNSNDTASAPRGGDLGWLTPENILPEIRGAVDKMTAGQISAPLEGPAGYHIIQVGEIRPAGTPPLEEVKNEVTALMRNRRAAANREAHITSLLQRQPVSINELALESVK